MSNDDISWSTGRQSYPPSSGASERFSHLDVSFIFTFSQLAGAFQFSPKDLLFLFFIFFFFIFVTRG